LPVLRGWLAHYSENLATNMKPQVTGFILILGLCLGTHIPAAAAACGIERDNVSDSTVFMRHLSRECSQVDRASHAVTAAEIIGAIKAGQGISLKNAVVTGDLLLTRLASVPIRSLSLPDRVLSKLSRGRVTDARVIRGPFLIEDSVVDGIVDTQLKPDMVEQRLLGDMVVIQGPVSFRGTTFTKTVDLSRTIFLGPLDSSQTIFLEDSFWLSCIFDKPATFEKTAFAGNARFYQSVFHESITYLRAGFAGLTNFLSVTFQKEAGFSRAYFKMGTSFSGSRFEGMADFSEAVFEKAAFFMSTVFAADTYFRRATFQGEANFSDASFLAKDDFAKVVYKEEPNFTRVKFANPRTSVGFENPVFLAIVGAGLTAFLIAFIVILKKG